MNTQENTETLFCGECDSTDVEIEGFFDPNDTSIRDAISHAEDLIREIWYGINQLSLDDEAMAFIRKPLGLAREELIELLKRRSLASITDLSGDSKCYCHPCGEERPCEWVPGAKEDTQ